MTITTETSSVVYNGDGVTLEFPYLFKILENEDLNVFINGVFIAPDHATYPYTISGAGEDAGGLVTFTLTPPLVGTSNVSILRDMEATQEIDYTPYDDFPAESHERGLDKLTMLVQEATRDVTLAIRIPANEVGLVDVVTPPVALRRNQVLAFDEFGNVTVVAGPGGVTATLVGIHPGDATYIDSRNMLAVDNATLGARLPLMAIVGPNIPFSLLQLNGLGAIPSDILALSDLVALVSAFPDANGDLLYVNHLPDGEEQVGVNSVNSANRLMMLDGAGAIPSSIRVLSNIVENVNPFVIVDGGGAGIDITLLTAVRSNSIETIGVNALNTPYHLMQLSGSGGIGDSILEISTVLRSIIPQLLVDGGGTGVDVELLTATYGAGGIETIGVKNPNLANQLLQLDNFGQIPADLLTFQGLRTSAHIAEIIYVRRLVTK